jgi:anti-anti-sigma factor
MSHWISSLVSLAGNEIDSSQCPYEAPRTRNHFRGTSAIDSIIIQNIFDSLPVGLLVINSEGEIILANGSASEILGYLAEAIPGKGWADLFLGTEGNDLFNQVMVDVIWEEKRDLHRTVPYARPHGDVLQLAITSSFIRDGEEALGIVVLLNDVTEVFRLHLQEKTILEERNRLQRERTEGLNNLAMAVAHQLRNPTTAIGGFASILLKKAEAGAMSVPYLENILSATKRLEDLVLSVQEYASFSAVSPRKMPVSRICKQLQQHVWQKAAELSRHASLTINSVDFDVEVDPRAFVEALYALLDNAVEAIPLNGGSIEVSMSQDEEVLLVTIQDNGSGISEENLSYVFDPFFTTKAVGVGMGLCKAKRIIAEHHGNLWIDSAAGSGTKVLIRVPRAVTYSLAMEGEPIMEIVEHITGEATVLTLKGRLDSTSATDLKNKVKSCAKNGRIRLVIDMAEVDFVDSSGLGSLVACLRSVNKLGGDIRIAALQERVRAVFELIRLHHIFEIFAAVETASNSFESARKDAAT